MEGNKTKKQRRETMGFEAVKDKIKKPKYAGYTVDSIYDNLEHKKEVINLIARYGDIIELIAGYSNKGALRGGYDKEKAREKLDKLSLPSDIRKKIEDIGKIAQMDRDPERANKFKKLFNEAEKFRAAQKTGGRV